MCSDYDVDIVVPWVNGADPAWLDEKKKWIPSSCDAGDEIDAPKRYRDLGLMKYWFRGIEKFAPWVRKVHFITWGHLPDFLNTKHPKLHIVNHKDFIPYDCLPTYNANAIEVSLHKIPDLAEHFVYFNDDFFLLKKTEIQDFFQKGKPVLVATECPLFQEGLYGSFLKNSLNLVNKNFNKRIQIGKNLRRLSRSVSLLDFFCNVISLPWEKYLGFKVEHGPVPYLKKTWIDVWEKEASYLEMTQRSRFREWSNVNQDLFHFWQIANGNFVQNTFPHKMIVMSDEKICDICSVVERQKLKSICINDGNVSDFGAACERINDSFEKILPQKSLFEK